MMAENVRYHRPMSKTLANRLTEAALHYLGRYESSVQSLRRVLKRRVERWSKKEEWEADAAAFAAIEAVIEKLKKIGAVDDSRYAEIRVAGMHRAGRSGRAIRSHLAIKGITADIADQAMADRPDDADFEAALLLAKRKRLGRFRLPDQRAEKRDKDLSALGRAGFSWEIAKRIVDQDD
jgi:regulatory protein